MIEPAAAETAFGNQAEFARAQGWQKGYVSNLKRDDRLVFTAAGQVDFAASLARIKATSGALERAAPPVQGQTFEAAQDAEKFYSAQLRRLEFERQVGTVRGADDVLSVIDDAAAIFRAGVESWAATLPAQMVALAGDEARMRAFLEAECERLLRRVSESFASLGQPEAPAP
jgi:hypothetical protein